MLLCTHKIGTWGEIFHIYRTLLHHPSETKLKPDIKSALDSSLLRSQQDSSPPHLNESLLVPLTDSTKAARDLSSNDSKVTSRRRSHSPGSQTTESRIDPATYVISKKRQRHRQSLCNRRHTAHTNPAPSYYELGKNLLFSKVVSFHGRCQNCCPWAEVGTTRSVECLSSFSEAKTEWAGDPGQSDGWWDTSYSSSLSPLPSSSFRTWPARSSECSGLSTSSRGSWRSSSPGRGGS